VPIRDSLLRMASAGFGIVSKALEGAAGGPEDDDEEDGESSDATDASSDEGDTVSGKNPKQGLPVSPLIPTEVQDKHEQRVPQTPEELQLASMKPASEEPMSLFWDPYAVIDALGYKDKPTPITYATLTAMKWRMPIIQAIHRTRINQVLMFSRPQADKYLPGYRVVPRNRKTKPTPAMEARSQQIEQWLLTTGTTEDGRGRDDFASFLTKIVSDSLTYDQMTFEVCPAADGTPATFYATDASTFRLADSTKLFVDPEDQELARYVQIYDGSVVSQFSNRRLCFGVRNPSTDIRLQGYGQSELEMLVTTVTALLWAWDYNQKFFSQGAGVKGILNFKGKIPDKHLRAFRRHWYSMVAGVENSFRTPIMNAEDMQWVSLQANNRDMEFNAWFDFLIKVACSIYCIDPMEINFKYGNSGAGGGKEMFESGNQGKLTASKDKGLKPLLRFLEGKLSTYLVSAIDPDFELEFVGLESDTPKEQAELMKLLVTTTHTVDEVRSQFLDMPPLPNGQGATLLDPVFAQHQQAAAQALHQQVNPQEGADGLGNPAPAPPMDPNEDPDFAGLDGEDSGKGDSEAEKSLGRYLSADLDALEVPAKRVQKSQKKTKILTTVDF
jgi:hypothetical protein